MAALVTSSVVATAGPAGAAPANSPRSDLITLHCDNGDTYDVVTAGNGDFTPAHVIGAPKVLVPTAFGGFTGTVYDAAGAVLASFAEPPSTKGASTKPRGTSTTCTFAFTFTGYDEDFGQVVTFVASGSATVFVTPAN